MISGIVDDRIDLGVKLGCNKTTKEDLLIPYLLIYEKVLDSEMSRQGEISIAIQDKENVSISFQNKDLVLMEMNLII